MREIQHGYVNSKCSERLLLRNQLLIKVPPRDVFFLLELEMSDLAMKVLKWQSTGDVGISSATLASIACGLKKNIYGHHFGAPHDAADFRRCVALVEQIPEIRD